MQRIFENKTMEKPPSSTNNREMMTESRSEDPLSSFIIPESYIIITKPDVYVEADASYYVSAYWAKTGPAYLGKFSRIGS